MCVQFHGARRLLQIERTPAAPAQPQPVQVLVSEIDSTYLKTQKRGRRGPVAHFPVHLGLHYTGRLKRYRKRASQAASLARKEVLISIEPLATFARKFQRRAAQLFKPKHHVLLSDGDEGIERQREQFFPEATWLLDRWHIAQQVRAFTGPQQQECHRIMRPIRQAQSEAALQALAQSALRSSRPTEFQRLFGYLLGNREGIHNWSSTAQTRPLSRRQIRLGRCREEYRNPDQPSLQTTGPQLESRSRTTPPKSQGSLRPTQSLEPLLETTINPNSKKESALISTPTDN